MIGQQIPLILVPRYTSYMGAGDYLSAPIDVTPYSEGSVTVWRGELLGGGPPPPSFKFYVQVSTDAKAWSDWPLHVQGSNDYVDPGTDATILAPFPCDRRWIRARVVLGGGSSPAVSCWAAGFVVQRINR